MKPVMFKAGLDFLHYSGLSRAAGPLLGGAGAIFMLHHVRPVRDKGAFAPNAGLEVTPEFLDAVISFVRARGFALLSLREAARRLKEGELEEPFAVFTLDDGFRDNLEHALPVFRARECPFTVFVAPEYADGRGELWWDALEEAIRRNGYISPALPGAPEVMETHTEEEMQEAWETLYWPVRSMEQHEQRLWIRDFAPRHGVDLHALCRGQVMDWEELRTLCADPLCDIGAHTMNHYALALLDEGEAAAEMRRSRERLEEELGREVSTFAYPYGDEGSAGPREFRLAREAGFEAAVTTRKGLIYPGHRAHPTALPRVSLNGFYQKIRYVDVLLTGAPFVLLNRLRRLNVA